MNKLYIAMAAAALAGLTACDPDKDDIGSGFDASGITADNIQATATPIVVDGKNTNKIVVECTSPITVQWTVDQLIEASTLSSKSYDTLLVTKTGNVDIALKAYNRVTDINKVLTVKVDVLSTLTSAITDRLGEDVNAFDDSWSDDKVTIEQETDGGIKGNVWTVSNKNGVLTEWFLIDKDTKEVKTSSTLNSDKLLVISDKGNYEITMKRYYTTGASDSISLGSYEVTGWTTKPEVVEFLSGDNNKTTWKWYTGNAAVWGNGPWASGNGPAWWTVNLADIDGQAAEKVNGVGRNGKDASFTLDFTTGIATSADGAQCKFAVLPLKHQDEAWDKGVLHFDCNDADKNFVVPLGINVNDDAKVFNDFYILVTEKEDRDGNEVKCITLTAPEHAMNSCAWFYLFEEVTE